MKLIDQLSSQWEAFINDIEDLQSNGITLENLADTAGVSRWTIYRMMKGRTTGFQQNFAIIKTVSTLKEDFAKLPGWKKRKHRKNRIKKNEVRVVKGS